MARAEQLISMHAWQPACTGHKACSKLAESPLCRARPLPSLQDIIIVDDSGNWPPGICGPAPATLELDSDYDYAYHDKQFPACEPLGRPCAPGRLQPSSALLQPEPTDQQRSSHHGLRRAAASRNLLGRQSLLSLRWPTACALAGDLGHACDSLTLCRWQS